MQRCPPANGPHYLHSRALAVRAFNVNNFITLAHAEVHRLLG